MVAKLLWVATVLAFLNNLLGVRDIKAGILIVVFCGGSALLVSYLAYTSKMISQTKYFAIASCYITVFIFIAFTPGMLSYFTIYISLFLLGIYQDQQVTAISVVISLAISTYAFLFHKEMIFHPRYYETISVLAINFFIVLSGCLLVLQGEFGTKVHREIEKEKKEI